MKNRNRERESIGHKKWLNENPAKVKARQKIVLWRRTARRLLVIQEKGGRCVDCPQDYPLFLEFDHVDVSAKSKSVAGIYGLAEIRLEAEKCVLRCSNCHRLKTWINGDVQRGHKRNRQG